MYPLSLLIVPFVFMIWPFFLKKTADNKASIFVALAMGTVSCILSVFILAGGIVVDGVEYNTVFLAYSVIPLIIYYINELLKNIIDKKEQKRFPRV